MWREFFIMSTCDCATDMCPCLRGQMNCMEIFLVGLFPLKCKAGMISNNLWGLCLASLLSSTHSHHSVPELLHAHTEVEFAKQHTHTLITAFLNFCMHTQKWSRIPLSWTPCCSWTGETNTRTQTLQCGRPTTRCPPFYTSCRIQRTSELGMHLWVETFVCVCVCVCKRVRVCACACACVWDWKMFCY